MAESKSNTVAFQVLVEGRVTGVGFRFSTYYKVKPFSTIRGYVRNTRHDQVEVVLQGPEPEVAVVLAWLKHGPPGARVDQCHVKSISIHSNLPLFEIAY